MKTTLQKLSLLLILTAIIASCSVQKRRYNKGWHVEWASSHTKTNKAPEIPASQKPAIKAYQPAAIEQGSPAAALSSEKQTAAPLTPVVTAEAPHAPASKAAEATSAKAPVAKAAVAKATSYKAVDTSRPMKDSLDDGTDTLAILSFIFALVGLFTGIGFLLALIFGLIALDRYRDGRGSPDKKIFAQLGFLIGLIGLIVFLLVLLLLIALVW